MKRLFIFSLLFCFACAPLPPATQSPVPIAATPTLIPLPESTATSVGATTKDYAIFSINVQDFSHPAESAALLNRILDLHEETGVPVDVYLTDVMARIYAEQFPALVERLRTSPVAAVSYHDRPPRPYTNNYDWLGLEDMPAQQQYETILRYETHAVDPVTGQTTDEAGGYQYVAELIGYPPYAASSLTSGGVDQSATRVFRELGARLTVVHGRASDLGEKKDGLYVRPEHFDYLLFQHAGEDAAAAFESALAQARASGGQAPFFVGVKMHDNDFFATKSAWTTVYMNGGKRPNWDPTLSAPLLSSAEQEAMWAIYEQTVRYVASQSARVTPVNLPMILQMLSQ
jgi:hypothetical protein